MGKKNKKMATQVIEQDQPAEEVLQEVTEAPVIEELVDFDTWFSQREPKIPSHHHKEILKADFRGRKVPAMATMAQFDEALKKYGVKLV